MKLHAPPYILREIKIEVTHSCPLACVHCSSDASPSCQRKMSKDVCLRIVSEAAAMGVKEIAFSGGEPLMWDGIQDAVGTACANDLDVNIYTSGNVPDVEATFGSIKAHRVKQCVFSLFGATAENHERVTRVGGSYRNTLKAVATANDVGIESEIHFVPLADNFEELEAIAKLSRKHKAAQISVLRFVPQGRGQLIRRQTLNRLQNLRLKRTIERLRQKDFIVRTGSPYNFLMLNDQPECCSGIDRLII